MFSDDYSNTSLFNVHADLPLAARLNHRRSLDYGTTTFSLAGPNKSKNMTFSRHHSIPSSPSHFASPNPSTATKNMIFIRRQSSDKCLQKRHSVDSNNSNNSDPGYSSINNKIFLSPSQQRSPRESNSPKSCHSSIASVMGRNSSCSSMAFLSRQSSTNSSKLPQQREPEENLQNHKWFSSSSVILTRVKSMKEKFRRVVVQSVQPDDWPPPSILFSDRYRCPSSSLSINLTAKTPPQLHRASSHLVKSKSIDPSSFPIISSNSNKKMHRNYSSAGSGRYFKRERLQRSMTSYTESIDNNENGIVCSDIDLKAIISTFKREGASLSQNKYNNGAITDDKTLSKTPIGTSSVMGPGFGKRKLMRKQVSFDDEQGIMMINRKVSAIAEEIECHTAFENNIFERQPSVVGTSLEENNAVINNELSEEPAEHLNQNSTNENDNENCETNEACQLTLLPKEIEFDEYGQTWEIYGADPDPEILGQAIQHHLERLMVCRQIITIPNGNATRPKIDIVVTDQLKIEQPKKISIRVLKPLRVDLQSSDNNLRFLARRLCGKWSCFSSGHQDTTIKVVASIDQTP